ncbi:CGNR zinc finger domain-containing protein [Streptomyces sp. NPDC002889]|uniref:CGNR zinc finger domain-containing protein n=1 Tax=Streptomyces sp. NPDC002889 TaxID=3364669 RepID=UPI0036CA4EB4
MAAVEHERAPRSGVLQHVRRLGRGTRGDDGLGRWRTAPSAGLRLPVWAVARSTADLLADPRRFTIRACPGPGCGWLFPDESGRRRWCSLSTCGNGTPVR